MWGGAYFGEEIIGFIDFNKLLLGVGILTNVWVVYFGEPSVGSLYFRFGGAGLESQRIEVFVFHPEKLGKVEDKIPKRDNMGVKEIAMKTE